jgi:hypothetical protein
MPTQPAQTIYELPPSAAQIINESVQVWKNAVLAFFPE